MLLNTVKFRSIIMQVTETIDQFFQSTGSSQKYIITSQGNHVLAPAGSTDHDPTTRQPIGTLIEQQSMNYFNDSVLMSRGIILNGSGLSITTSGVAGGSHALRIPRGKAVYGEMVNRKTITSQYIAISMFVKVDGGGVPIIGYMNDEKAHFTITLDGAEAPYDIEGDNIQVHGPLSDGSYRFRIRLDIGKSSVTDIGIGKSKPNLGGCLISKVQIEKDIWTSYIPTNGSPASRSGDSVFKKLTHGIHYNKDQGTIEVKYTPMKGSGGAVCVLHDSTKKNYIVVGDIGTGEIAKLKSDDHTKDAIIGAYSSRMWEPDSIIRASFSGYGVRTCLEHDGSICYLKEYNTFKTSNIDTITVASDIDGRQFSGHISYIKLYGRTFTEDELKGGTAS